MDPDRYRFLAALTRFDHVLGEAVLPEDTGTVHAVFRLRSRRIVEPEIQENPALYGTAKCGATVKVLLPVDFDGSDENDCQSCAMAVHETRVRLSGDDSQHR